MEILSNIVKVVIALSLLNVWILRFNKMTPYRGGQAQNMKEEFTAYGLPKWFMYAIGVLKIGFALLLLASIFYPGLEKISLYGIGLLMLGAIGMHLKIKDIMLKSLPALMLFLLTVFVMLA
ncbi:MAG: DoxX family protein [Bacteroidia bacterium]|nr:DoxX family protein [Bacteroidia bacterium]NNK70720.1 DoxX family protein [Flavobacteriaceae bacterium]NNL79966.1 DoxX family protein [Flavobacteriaceae bacterium]